MAGQPIDPLRIKPLSPHSSPTSYVAPPSIVPGPEHGGGTGAIAVEVKPTEERKRSQTQGTVAIATSVTTEAVLSVETPSLISTSPGPTRRLPPPPPPAAETPPRAKRRGWGTRLLWQTGPFPLAWILFVLGVSGLGVGAFFWLTTLPPMTDCRQSTPLTTESERLFCADQAARGGKVADIQAALQLVQGWGPEHPLHNQAQAMVRTWSKTLLLLARQKADRQDLEGAIALAQQVPKTIPDYKEVSTAIATWKDIRDQGRKIDALIQAALKVANWSEAQSKLLDLAKLDDQYSRQNVTRLRQQINLEQNAARQLDTLRNQVKAAPTQIEILGQSILAAEAIAPSTYVAAKAEKEIQRWMKTLSAMMSSRLAKSDWVGAHAVAQQLPLYRTYRTADRHALWIARAGILATDKLPNDDLVPQLWTLWTTIPPLQEIATIQPFSDEAKDLLPRLTWQSQDLIQLQLAQTLAQVRLEPALRLAAGMLTAVTPERPQRVAAQTLLAQWRKELELVEDYPVLLTARAIAQDGAKPSLQAAIAQARLVTPKRARRLEAQTLIAQWTGQIQVIEDRPILNQAREMAAKGNLGEAIRIAGKIQPKRTLYPEAQSAIGDWVTQIQIAEDQAIMDRAQGLAAGGQLSAAIDVASQITPDRPLYRQIQGDVNSWIRERDAIIRERQAEASDSNSTAVGAEGSFNGTTSDDSALPPADGSSSN